MANERQRLFVDMDGTLAVFTPVKELEQLYEEGYFWNQAPHVNVVKGVQEILVGHPEIEVFILSAYLTDSPSALQEKNRWLNRYLPQIDQTHRIFLPCGADKTKVVPGGIRENDFLLDDYTKNLNDWEPPARGIKLLNGINHTKGTWQSDRIRYDHDAKDLAELIVKVMQGKERVKDAPAYSALTDPQADVLAKIARRSRMDCWFCLSQGNDAVFDMETGNTLSLREGVRNLIEGMTDCRDYDMTEREVQLLSQIAGDLDITESMRHLEYPPATRRRGGR